MTRRPCALLWLAAALAAASWTCPAGARNLYKTDFETFPAGSDKWAGHDNWITNDGGTGSSGIDQDAVSGGSLGKTGYIGAQKPGTSFVYVAQPVKYTAGQNDLQIVEIETLVGIKDSSLSNPHRDDFYVSIWNKSGEYLAGIRFSNQKSTYGLWREDGSDTPKETGFVFVREELHLIFMRIDLAANTWSAEIDGVPMFSNATFNASGKTVDMGYLAYEWQISSQNTSSFGNNWMLVADALVRNWQKSGDFSYRTIGGKVEIMDYPTAASGTVAIPELIGGMPVTAIGGEAFAGCSEITRVEIPSSVSAIGVGAFDGCTSLASLSADPGGTAFSSAGGVLFNASGDELVQFPKGRPGAYTVPAGTKSIRNAAFAGCAALTSVTLPPSLESIGGSAFAGCSALSSAVFLGNAPTTLGVKAFDGAASGFSVAYLAGNSGFSTPTWKGYPASPTDPFGAHFASWLSARGLPADSPPGQDADGDGVDLLMAYALNLDPAKNLAGSMPKPVLAPETLSISYYAASPAVTYTAETSTDLRSWTTSGVTISGTPENRTASVSRNSPRRFLRLRVEKAE